MTFASEVNEKRRLVLCLVVNVAILLLTMIIVFSLKEEVDEYFQLGPNPKLKLMSIRIDDWQKYFFVHIYLLITECANVIINDIAGPKLGFTVFNPDKKIIEEFTRNEIQLIANSYWLINGIRSSFTILLSLSQFDIALARVVYSEITSIYTIRLLLNEKTFPLDGDIEQGKNK